MTSYLKILWNLRNAELYWRGTNVRVSPFRLFLHSLIIPVSVMLSWERQWDQVVSVHALKAQNDQLQVQLAGCLTAAEGQGDRIKEGSFGWSPAYQAVINLREKCDERKDRPKDRPEDGWVL